MFEWLGGKLPRDNNFDIIRLFAALQVVTMHSVAHLKVGISGRAWEMLILPAGVPIFFYISGLLVTSSLAGRSLTSYAEARARRVLPALWAAFAVALLILVLFGQIGSAETRSPQFWAWVVTQLTVFQVFNPDMFRDFGVGVVNGSLWTIPVEIGFYCILPVVVWLAGKSSNPRRSLTLLALAGAAVSFVIHRVVEAHAEQMLFKLVAATPLAHFWLFAMGVLTYLHLHRALSVARCLARFPLGYTYPALAYFTFRLTIGPMLPEPVEEMIGTPLLMAGVFCLGLAAPSKVAILRGHDLSYSLYLFHMLVVNSFVALGLFGWSALAPAVALSLVLAGLSWRFVESRALARKARAAPASAPVPSLDTY